jgi:hypothetical protein
LRGSITRKCLVDLRVGEIAVTCAIDGGRGAGRRARALIKVWRSRCFRS